MIRRLLVWLTARLPVKIIGRTDDPYVEWYHVATVFGLFRVQLHHFLRSDPDDLHDHPWGWACSIVLAGWYIEERRDFDRVRSRCYFLGGDTFHRVVLPRGQDVWTLFIHGPYVKHWGFLRPVVQWAFGTAPIVASWHVKEGGAWAYDARPRHHERFDSWPFLKGGPRGSDIREAAINTVRGEQP